MKMILLAFDIITRTWQSNEIVDLENTVLSRAEISTLTWVSEPLKDSDFFFFKENSWALLSGILMEVKRRYS